MEGELERKLMSFKVLEQNEGNTETVFAVLMLYHYCHKFLSSQQ